MIDIENLNNQEFSEIIEKAKKQIEYLSDDWSDTAVTDPGMTLIDLFAWLKVVQQEYMNQISDESQYKFLELLDIKDRKNKGATTLIHIDNVSSDLVVPRGTKWCANDMVFENAEAHTVTAAKIQTIDFQNSMGVFRVPYANFDGKRIFYLFGQQFEDDAKNREFQINFDVPVSRGVEFGIYFDIFMESKYKRNPVSDTDKFFELADIQWEYYGTENGETGWHKLRVISDKTHNFLFSGTVNFFLDGEMKSNKGMFSIRAKMVSQNYDFPPRITNVFTNVLSVSQKSTLCENNLFCKKDISGNGIIKVQSHLALYGEYIVYAKIGSGWNVISDYVYERDINKGETRFRFDWKILNEIKTNNLDEPVIMIVAYDDSIKNKMVLGHGTGMSDQSVQIKVEDIYYDDFNMMVGYEDENKLNFDIWEKTHSVKSCGKDAKCYELDLKESTVSFGNHEFGVAPRKALNNMVLIGLATTLGKKSNIKSKMITKVISRNSKIKDFNVLQITNAVGGVDPETFEDVKSRAADSLNNRKKAVTEKDYEDIAKQTPGLIVGGVKVLPSYLPDNMDANKQNCVTIVIRGPEDKDINLQGYKDNIKRQIDKYRLINTRVEVVEPVYIGLDISGQIVVNSYYRKSSNLILNNIKDFVKKVNQDTGTPFYYGDLFGMLDRLDCVSYVDKLYVSPIGNYIEKTASEDIIIPPNGVYYIEKVDLNYVNSAKID